MPLQGGHVASQIGCLALRLCLASEMANFRDELKITNRTLFQGVPDGILGGFDWCVPGLDRSVKIVCSKCNLPSSDSIAKCRKSLPGRGRPSCLAISLQLKLVTKVSKQSTSGRSLFTMKPCAAQSF